MNSINQTPPEQLEYLAQMLKDRHSKPHIDQPNPSTIHKTAKDFDEEDFLPNIMQVTPEDTKTSTESVVSNVHFSQNQKQHQGNMPEDNLETFKPTYVEQNPTPGVAAVATLPNLHNTSQPITSDNNINPTGGVLPEGYEVDQLYLSPCLRYSAYYTYLYEYFQNTPYICGQVKTLLEELLPITNKKDIINMMTFDTPTKWEIYLVSIGYPGGFSNMREGIIKLMAIWTLIENPKHPNKVIKMQSFIDKWFRAYLRYKNKLSGTPNKPPPPYTKVSPMVRQMKIEDRIDQKLKSAHAHQVAKRLFETQGNTPQDSVDKEHTPTLHHVRNAPRPDSWHDRRTTMGKDPPGHDISAIHESTDISITRSVRSCHRSTKSAPAYANIDNRSYRSSSPRMPTTNSTQRGAISVNGTRGKRDYSMFTTPTTKEYKARSVNHGSICHEEGSLMGTMLSLEKGSQHSKQTNNSRSRGHSKKSSQSYHTYSPFSHLSKEGVPEHDSFAPSIASSHSKGHSKHSGKGSLCSHSEVSSRSSKGSSVQFSKRWPDLNNPDFQPHFDPDYNPSPEINTIPHTLRYRPCKTRPKFEKAKWDGTSSSFRCFARALEGHLLQVGAGYLINPKFYAHYRTIKSYTRTLHFWKKHFISIPQAEYDVSYLYGILKSATMEKENKTLNTYKRTKDGVRAWHEFMKEYEHGGTFEIRVKELEKKALEKFNVQSHGTIDHFLNELEAIIAELMTLVPLEYPEVRAKKTILTSVGHVESIKDICLTCEKKKQWGWRKTSNYIRTNSYNRAYLYADQVNVHQVSSATPPSDSVTMTKDEAESLVSEYVNHYGIKNACNMFSVPKFRESLRIPGPIWALLEPELQAKLMEVRKRVLERKNKLAQKMQLEENVQNAETTNTANNNNNAEKSNVIPDQYPKMKGVTHTVQHICTALDELELGDEDSLDTDDEQLPLITRGYMSRSLPTYRAHLEYAAYFPKIYALSDCGADACVLGKLTYVEACTGEKAYLSGFDPAKVPPKEVSIVTGLIKVLTSPQQIPVILRVHQAPYNPDSPITLLSEYQIREHGYVIDSVAKKHRTGFKAYGTQTFYLNEVVSIPFEDRGGLMGFEILPYEEGDKERYDVFDITSPEKWTPQRFRLNNTTIQKVTKPEVPTIEIENMKPTNDGQVEEPGMNLDNDSGVHVEKGEDLIPGIITIETDKMVTQDQDEQSEDTWFSLVNRYKRPKQKDLGMSDAMSWNVWNRAKRFDAMKRVLTSCSSKDKLFHYDPVDENQDKWYDTSQEEEEIWFEASQTEEETNKIHACQTQDMIKKNAEQLLEQFSYDTLTGNKDIPSYLEGYPHYCDINDEDNFVDNDGQPYDIPLVSKELPNISTALLAKRAWHRVIHKQVDPHKLKKYFLGRPVRIIKKTMEITTQLATMIIRHPLRKHVKRRIPRWISSYISETVSTDPFFVNIPSLYHGYLGMQLFFCTKSRCIMGEGLKSKGEFPQLYKDFMRKHGVPSVLRRDNSKEQNSEQITEINRERGVKDEFSEPYNPQQNPVELNAVKYVKENVIKLLESTGAPLVFWYFAAKLVIEVYNFCSNPHLPDGISPIQYLKGDTPDISAYLQFTFYQRILYLDNESNFPASKERSGRWLGVSENTGDSLTFIIVDEQSKQILHRSVVRPFYNNLQVKWDARLAVNPEERKTARHGGDIMPSKEERESKLADIMDEYDEQVPDLIARDIDQPQSVIKKSILKMDRDIPTLSEQLIVPALIQNKDDKLVFGSNPMPIKRDHDHLQWEGKKPYQDCREDNLYAPSTSPQNQLFGQERVSFEKGTKPPPNKNKEQHQSDAHGTVRKKSTHGMRLRDRGSKHRLLKGLVAIGVTMLQFHTGLYDVQPKLPETTSIVSESIDDYRKPLDGTKLEHLRAYHARLDLMSEMLHPEPRNYEWQVQGIMKYRVINQRPYVKVQYFGGTKQWISIDTLRLHDPYLAIRYGKKQNLLNTEGWEWVEAYGALDEAYNRMVQAYKASVRKNKIKFGIEVPYSTKEALRLDQVKGTSEWRDSINLEIKMLLDFKTFITLEDHEELPEGYKWIPYHCVMDAKFDGRLKTRLVAGGHMTNPPTEDVFSGVVGMETVRLGFILARLNNLMVCAGDVSQAFLYGKTREKVYIIAGDEFPEDMRGKRLIIDKALYGLKSSSARFHEHSSEKLRTMGFRPSKVDADLWYRKQSDHYEYIARYVDDLIVYSRAPMEVMAELQETYHMKGVGKPQYYLGGDVLELGEEWEKENVSTAFSAETYIRNALPRLAKACGLEQFHNRKVPISEMYHPELDESPLLDEKKITLYKSLIGSANWIVTLGRFDIAYAVSTFARYSMAPREGHLENLQKLFGYLRNYAHGKILIDVKEPPDRKIAIITKNQNWSEFYPDAKEEVPEDMLEAFGQTCSITCYVDSDHARDKLTRRSVTGVILLVNNTPVVWLSKRQGTVETSTYGAELIATRVAVEMIIAWRYNLRMLGMKLEEESYMLGDNMAVVLNTTIPSSILKKKNQSCNWHKVREAIAAGFIVYGHIKSEENVADICTKPLGGAAIRKITSKYLFRKPKMESKEEGQNE